jgi:hypothetical protein
MKENDYTEFLHQLSGKTGSINKEADGFAVPPIFDNIHSVHGHTMGKFPLDDYLKIDDSFITTKELLVPFHGNSGSTGKELLAYLAPGSRPTWHSTTLDPVITLDKEFEYYSSNIYQKGPAPFIMKRDGYNSCILTDGKLNFREGQDVMKFKEYYMNMNSGYNLIITSKYEFGRLSRSPMMRVENPSWKILAIQTNWRYKQLGEFEYYNQLPSGLAIFKPPNDQYGIYINGDEVLLKPEASTILPVYIDEYEYLLVKKPITGIDGISESKWTVYNYSGQILPTSYEEVEVVSKDLFKVTDNGTETLIDTSGNVIYTYD